MPWCPKCKTEYRDGIDVCSDCGSKLVATLEQTYEFDKANMLNFLYGPEEQVESIRKYLSGVGKLKAYSVYNEKKEIYELFIKPEDQARATQLVNQFFEQVNAQQVSGQNASQAAQKQQRMPAKEAYRSAKERAADHKNSAIILMSLGVIGLTVIVLMALGVFPFVSLSGMGAILTYTVMGGFFLMFIIMSVVSFKSYKELSRVDIAETNTNKELDEFCAKYLTKEFIDSKIAPLISDESQEYFYRAEFMRKVISDKYPELGASFLEDYIDTKYGEIFES